MLNMSCRKRIRERNWLLLSLLNYAFSFIVIAVHRFHQVCENAHLLLSSMPLSPLSHDVNYRFWMSSSSNYSGADLLLFLSLSIDLSIYRSACIVYMWLSQHEWQQTWKYPYRGERERTKKLHWCFVDMRWPSSGGYHWYNCRNDKFRSNILICMCMRMTFAAMTDIEDFMNISLIISSIERTSSFTFFPHSFSLSPSLPFCPSSSRSTL